MQIRLRVINSDNTFKIVSFIGPRTRSFYSWAEIFNFLPLHDFTLIITGE